MYRLTKGLFYNNGFVLPYNDVVPSEYCFLNVLSETGDAKSLRRAVIAQGATPTGKVRSNKSEDTWQSRSEPTVARYLATTEVTERWGSHALVAYAWVAVPSRIADESMPLRAEIGPLTAEQVYEWHQSGCEYDLGVSNSYGELADTDTSNGPVIIAGWEFYHTLPLLGYTWQSFLVHSGHDGTDESAIEPFGFEDDSDVCNECNMVDSRDDGYTYNFRETPSGNYAGVNCGCYDAACESEYLDNANEHEKCITLDLARKLAKQGKLEFVVRHIGGWTDPGRGGFFRIDEDEAADGETMCCENGDPSEVMAALLAAEPDAQFILSHDESGQFQTYWSAWRVVEVESEKVA